jgi:hypothetical protein
MDIVTRWVGLCGMLSAALVGACDSGSSSANDATAGAGVGGSGSAGAESGQAGKGNAGTSSIAGSTSSAGTGSGVGGASGGNGVGGSASDAGAGAGGKLGAGGSSGGSAGVQGGSGGTQGGGSCGGAQVVFLIQRSGALFEQPFQSSSVPTPLEASYFGFLQAALSGDASAAKPYTGKLPIGVSFLFAARDQVSATPAVCPELVTTAPSSSFDGALSAAFGKAAADHTALVMTAKMKAEAPVPESIASAVAAWSGASGPRHLVLVTTAMPDTCVKFDGPCGIDATVKAVQDAKAAGVTTHVIGLGDDNMFNASTTPQPTPTETGYEDYLQQLANAGSGKPLGPDTLEHNLQDYVCTGSTAVAALTASYGGTTGDAKYYQVKTATDAKSAVADILGKICP